MKNLQKTLLLLLLAFVCSCTSDKQLQEISNVKESTKVMAILSDWNIEDSRTTITTGPYPTAPSPIWVTGDSIGIYPDAGGDQLSFRINEGGTKTCSFDGGGWAMKSSSYTAYSPFKRSYYYEDKDALPISMLGQTQNGNDNADHLGTYDIQIAKGNKPEGGNLVFQFNRYVALARLEITAPKAATWASVTLESDALFTTEATMNLVLETPTITPVATSNSVTLNLKNVSTTDENLSIIAYMMLLPVDLTGKILSVKLTDVDNNVYTSIGTIANNKTNFAANAARWISVSFEELTPNNQIWYTSTDGNIINPFSIEYFGATIISNTYENGKGIITFDKNVTTIEFDAFSNCTSLTGITIPNSVTSIGALAFNGCTSLTNITIPNSVSVIKNGAFSGCTSLSSIIVEKGNPVYDSRDNCNAIIETETNTLIQGCNNTVIPNSVIIIDREAFYGCSSLTNITIPDNVTTIGESAFLGCTSLSNITIPNSVKTIGIQAFAECSSLTDFIIPNSVTVIEAHLFYCCTSLSNITIPNSVTTIGDNAFVGCPLTHVTIPSSVTIIGNMAFGKNALKRVDVKATNPPAIFSETFRLCENTEFYVPSECINAYKEADYWKDLNLFSDETIPNNQIWYTSYDNNIIDFKFRNVFGANVVSNVYENGKGIITFDGNVTSIGRQAFMSCRALTSITIPNSVTSIGEYTFSGCASLTSITIPDNVKTIGYFAFHACYSLANITLSRNLTSIGNQAFCSCVSLTSITIPSNVTDIGIQLFIGCDSLTNVTVEKNHVYDSRDNCNAIIETASNKLINGCKNTVIPNSVTSIGTCAFSQCSSLTKITIPNSVTEIQDGAFMNCTSLSEMHVLATTPPQLGTDVFYSVASNFTIYVPKSSQKLYEAANIWKDFSIVGE